MKPLPPLPHRLERVRQKATNAMFEGGAALVANGLELISLATARPNFDTPAVVKDALVAAIEEPRTYMTYTLSRGLPELRDVVAEKLSAVNHVDYDPASELLITAGTHEGLFVSLYALVGRGDEVLVLDPSWVAYSGMVRLAEAEPVAVPLANGRLDIEALRAAVTSRTRAFLFNNPNNPSGTVFTRQELSAIGEVATEHDLVVIVDEIYEEFVYDGHKHISIASLPGMRERTALINGYSKAYAMTGWRVGYVAAPAWLIDRMLLIHQHFISAPTSFAQKGAVAAYTLAGDHVRSMVAAYDQRRRLLYEGLQTIPHITFSLPEGACFFFIRFDTELDSSELAARVARTSGLVLTPGGAFGPSGERSLRLSFAALDASRVPDVIERLSIAVEEVTA